MNGGPTIFDYFASLYFLEVVVAALLGIALIFTVREGRRVRWPPSTLWRKFLVIAGWAFTCAATLVWIAVLYLTIGALITSMNPNVPKPYSLIFLILGGFIYFTLAGIAGTAFRASTGSAREDIMRKIGRSR